MWQLNTIVGVSASTFTAVSSIPQLVKIIKEKKAESISLIMVAILLSGLGLWTYYGILMKDIIIIISNSFSIVIYILIVVFSLYYKKDKQGVEKRRKLWRPLQKKYYCYQKERSGVL